MNNSGLIKKHLIRYFFQKNPVLSIIIPIILILLPVLLLWYTQSTAGFFEILGLSFLYLLPPIGKISIITTGMAIGFSWPYICLIITYVDLISCLIILWNFEQISQVSQIRIWIEYFNERGEDLVSRYPWVRRYCFFGLFTFVFIPVQGTGAIGGSVLGRILKLNSRCIFSAVIIGSILQSITLGFLVYIFERYLNINLWYLVGILLIVFIIPSTLSLVIHMRKRTRSRIKKD